MKRIEKEIKQCATCEQSFIRLSKDNTCPYCGSGNWVYGCIDNPDYTRKENNYVKR